ncbi:hypothetical protein AB6F62_16540 [Providencia huaxiensis]|uniref:hypothetical protein n=1 Tax=Providencia huaxiensis TaxID=2027290 RepID=UPI0034DD97CF
MKVTFKIAHMLYTEAAVITQAYHQEPPRLAKLTKRYFNEKDALLLSRKMTSGKMVVKPFTQARTEWREHLHIALTNVSKRSNLGASSWP